MAASVIEVVKAQTTSSTGALTATFAAAPLVGDRILAFVAFESSDSTAQVDRADIAISGLGATWRLLTTQQGTAGLQNDWYALYEAINLSGTGTTVSVSESSSTTTVNFAVTCFNVRGVPTGTQASAVYGLTQGTASNPPALTVTPSSAGDIVIGSWYQQSSALAPTVTTTPVTGWSSFSTTMTSMSVHWRYMTSTDTSTYSMDSGTPAMYSSFGVASVLGSARVTYGGLDAMVVSSAPTRRYTQAQVEVVTAGTVRRYNQAQLETVTSSPQRRYSQVFLEVLVARRQFKGWGAPI